MTTAKSLVIARELSNRLSARAAIAALGIVEAFDVDRNIYLTIGSTATTDEGAIVKVEPADWPLAKDALGLEAIKFTPHVIKILKEAAPDGGLTSVELLELIAQVAAMGTQVELYESASGAGVVLADIDDPTKLVAHYEPDAWRPLISCQ